MRNAIIARPSYTARQLSRRLRIKRFHPGNRLRKTNILINWGCANLPEIEDAQLSRVINCCAAVRRTNKITTLRLLREAGIPTVDFTTERGVAQQWVEAGKTIYGRMFTRASGGRGIYLLSPEREYYGGFPTLPLYTKFWRCDKELRVHVFGDKVIDFSEKRRLKLPWIPTDRYWIRNHDRGWVFARSDTYLPDSVKNICVRGVKALGLDFGAIDVRTRENGKCAILEINSAPGLTGTALTAYVQAFNEVFSK